MNTQQRSSYLFLLQRPSIAARREAAKRLRELGMTVVAQYGGVALEAFVDPAQSEAAQALGIFSAQLKGPMAKEHLAKLNPEQLQIVELWNTRFTKSYRALKKDLTHVDKPWKSPGLAEPLPYSAIGEEDFKQLIAEYEERTGKPLTEKPPEKPASRKKTRPQKKQLSAKEFVQYEDDLSKAYKDPNLAYDLARLAYRLGPDSYTLIRHLPPDLLDLIRHRFFGDRGGGAKDEDACWKMTGEISVGIVFVECSRRDGPKFGNTERNEICQEILDGHSWLTSEHPSGNLSWVYDIQFVKIGVADGSGDPDEAYWRDPAMGQVAYNGASYAGNWSGVGTYREDMRTNNLSDHAVVVFVTPYANSWHAYAGGGRVTLARKNNWGGWGRQTLDIITAHETGHLFGSADEYTGSGTPCSSCDTTHGCDQIPNGNCGACSHPHQPCMMDANSHRICAYTRGHIGWADLFVETTTADVIWAGTDDDVWVDIGDREFVLDTPDHDDRERGNVEGYAVFAGGLARKEIKRILIRKSPDGFAGGWKLKRVRVWHAGELICEHDNINQWLEDNHRVWVGCITDDALISSITVRISTADVGWAGTDDDVTLTVAGRSWDLDNPDHDDFERGHTDSFDLDPGTGFYLSDVHSIRITKSPDGIAGGWKLKGMELILNGSAVYNNSSINKWLEDDDRAWSVTL
jgi:hypothetical protein